LYFVVQCGEEVEV